MLNNGSKSTYSVIQTGPKADFCFCHRYRQLDSKLNAWKFSLPSEYGNMSRLFNPNGGNKIVNCIWIMLHTTYHTYVTRHNVMCVAK
jgi:hypothetical protein